MTRELSIPSRCGHAFVWHIDMHAYINTKLVYLPTYIHTYIHACMHACMHACIHACILEKRITKTREGSVAGKRWGDSSSESVPAQHFALERGGGGGTVSK